MWYVVCKGPYGIASIGGYEDEYEAQSEAANAITCEGTTWTEARSVAADSEDEAILKFSEPVPVPRVRPPRTRPELVIAEDQPSDETPSSDDGGS